MLHGSCGLKMRNSIFLKRCRASVCMERKVKPNHAPSLQESLKSLLTATSWHLPKHWLLKGTVNHKLRLVETMKTDCSIAVLFCSILRCSYRTVKYRNKSFVNNNAKRQTKVVHLLFLNYILYFHLYHLVPALFKNQESIKVGGDCFII